MRAVHGFEVRGERAHGYVLRAQVVLSVLCAGPIALKLGNLPASLLSGESLCEVVGRIP